MLVKTESVQEDPQQSLEAQMSLSEIKTNQDLATQIGWSHTHRLTWLGMNKSEHYEFFRIPKRSGGYRNIYTPSPTMRVAQHKLLTRLLDRYEIPEYIHAFEKARSIPKMAMAHVGKSVVLSIDINDFFTSIHQDKIYLLLLDSGLGPNPARLISELCTYKFFVPQGALTSPKISNMVVAKTFGPTVESYCRERGLTLSIYADDITISSEGRMEVSEVLTFLNQTMTEHGFKINRQKTKVMTKRSRHYVCGVVVNKKLNLVRHERKKLRAMVHNVTVNGLEPEALKNNMTSGEFKNHLIGRLGWFKQLNPEVASDLIDKLKDYLNPEIITLPEF